MLVLRLTPFRASVIYKVLNPESFGRPASPRRAALLSGGGKMLFRALLASTVAMFALVILLDGSVEGGRDKAPVAIKVVMQRAMKGGLCNKVAKGEATEAEKKLLIALFTDLAAAKPPKGDANDWREKTTALLEAARANDTKALKKAAY